MQPFSPGWLFFLECWNTEYGSSKLLKNVICPLTHYIPGETKQRLLKYTNILELYAGVPYTIWLPSTWYIQPVIYCRGHQCQTENPKTSWG